jgi:DHA1 family bicyclomycin/chloramphenicol resistance-like MFS transporter
VTSSLPTTETADAPSASAPPSTPATRAITTPLLLTLGLLSAVAPLSTDLYLASFPQMASDLGASTTQVQLTLTAFLAGLTVGQLVFGPLSDRLGRFRPLLVGSVLFVAASVAAAFAPSIGFLITARVVQGLAGAAGTVIARAIISDRAHGPAAASAYSLMMIVGGVAPVIAPVAGGALAGAIGWRGLLGIVLAMAVLMLVSVLAVVRESLPPVRRLRMRALRARDAARGTDTGAASMFRSRTFVGWTLTFAFSFAVMMAYISASPFLYQDLMGFGTTGYGIAFGVNAFALMVVSMISAKLTARIAPDVLVRVGLVAISASVAAALVIVLVGAPIITLMVPIFCAVASEGLIFGNATALALDGVPQVAGSASAVLGALQFGLGAVVSPLVSIGGANALPLVLVMAVCAVVAVIGMLVARRA